MAIPQGCFLIVRTVNSFFMTSCCCIIGRSVYLLDPTPKKDAKTLYTCCTSRYVIARVHLPVSSRLRDILARAQQKQMFGRFLSTLTCKWSHF